MQRVLPFLSLFLVGVFAFSQAPSSSTRAEEDAVIAANRKGARPRPVAKGRSLSALEQERAKIFRQARPSVVYINASTSRGLLDRQTGQLHQIPPGTGTGFVWDDLGHVVTNYHVIKLDVPDPKALLDVMENIEVTLSNNRVYKARLIGRNISNDIAVLHVFAPLKDLQPLAIGSSKNLTVGQSVLAIGNPFGLDHTLTGGIISALGRVLLSDFITPIEGVIQTDAAINPGNSGGPLLDLSGRLIGMNTAIPTTTGANVGVGFAMPVDTLNRIVPELIARWNPEHPTLGFATLGIAPAFELFGIERGIVVSEVEANSPAAQAGLKGLTVKGTNEKPLLGDVIVRCQGKPMDRPSQMSDEIELLMPGRPVVLEVLRDNQRVTLTLDPWKKPEPTPSALTKT